MPAIDPKRLISTLHHLSRFGAYRTGVHRPTFSSQDMAARHWFRDALRDIGYATELDGVGNVFGDSPCSGPRLLVGSHIESKDYAGWLDGALGVVYALETARAFQEDNGCAAYALDVVGWSDEESHFTNFLGSRSYAGELAEEDISAAASREGVPLRQALAKVGLEGLSRRHAKSGRHIGYLEAHIEQGDVLESAGLSLGIVDNMVGNWRYKIIFSGIQNHAGTTRMVIRKDPGVALARLCVAIAERFPHVAGPRSVWTTGRILLHPGDPGVIPGEAEMHFQFRDTDIDKLAGLERELYRLVDDLDRQGPCPARIEIVAKSLPQTLDEKFRGALEKAAARHADGAYQIMQSSASHDAQVMARIMPAGLLFVPSIGGISHHWSEDTREEDIVLGCRAFADACETILASG